MPFVQTSDAQETPCASIPQAAPEGPLLEKMEEARSRYQLDSIAADNIIWYGRRLAYTGQYMEAIAIFSRGIQLHPADARLYRHRGHRYISIRCFDKAISDFDQAAALVKEKPDEVEPDGMPNSLNIPTSTLQTNIYYHLGLAHFIQQNWQKAEEAFQTCWSLSKNEDMQVATANWLNIVLRTQGKNAEALQLFQSLPTQPNLIENGDYWRLLQLYYRDKPENPVAMDAYVQKLETENASLSSATLLFGMGYYCELKGMKAKANELYQKALDTKQWASFGFIVAESRNEL